MSGPKRPRVTVAELCWGMSDKEIVEHALLLLLERHKEHQLGHILINRISAIGEKQTQPKALECIR